MPIFLFAWELGGGMGHMIQILTLARELDSRGHKVFIALGDVSRALPLVDRDDLEVKWPRVIIGGTRALETPPCV